MATNEKTMTLITSNNKSFRMIIICNYVSVSGRRWSWQYSQKCLYALCSALLCIKILGV